MGMYTELILGCSLKKDTPSYVIDSLKFMLGLTNERPKDFPDGFKDGRFEWMFRCSSFYFGVSMPVNGMRYCDISNAYVLSVRCNLKNYDNEIESLLEWLKPFIDNGSGANEMYAIVMYEEAEQPTIYYLVD